MLTETEWETFFELMDKIVKMPGTWQEKRDTVQIESENWDADLEEFTGWFHE